MPPGDPLPPEEPPFPPELAVPTRPQPTVPSIAANAVAIVRTPIPDAILLVAFRSSFRRAAQFAEMGTPLTDERIVERRTCGKLLDAGTPVGQVLSPVREDSHFNRPSGPLFSSYLIDPALTKLSFSPIPGRPA